MRPLPTHAYHFTYIDHLPSIIGGVIWCDNKMQSNGLLVAEAGDPGIKDDRRRREVDVAPGGVVADYVPFYYTPLSPMLFKISRGSVATYQGEIDDLVFLVTTPERLIDSGRELVISDGNARSSITEFRSGVADLDTLVDWEVIRARWWHNTIEDGDRKRRRAAELLAHDYVPWDGIIGLAVRTTAAIARTEALLRDSGVDQAVALEPSWYY